MTTPVPGSDPKPNPFHAILDCANEAVVIARDGMLVYVNNRAVELMGRSSVELLGVPFLQFIHPEDRANVFENHTRRIKGEPAPARYAFRVVTANDTIRWAETSAAIAEWEGTPAVVNFITDITERRLADQILRDSEERYRLLAENIADVIWVLDLETSRFRYVSPSVEKLRGYTAEEVMAADMSAALTPETSRKISEALPGRLADFRGSIAVSYVDEIEQPRRDGSTVWTETTTRFHRNEGNGHIEVFGVSRDITQRRQSKESELESENKFRSLFETSSDAIMMVDRETGVILDSNLAACRLYGYTPQELLHLRHVDLSAEPDKTSGAIRTGFVKIPLRLHRKKDGTIFPVEITGGFFMIGRRPVHTASIRDISERVAAEKDRQRMMDHLNQTQKLDSLGVLAGGIAHDFNNLLGGVFGYLEMARDNTNDPSRVTRYLDKALSVFNRAKGLTEQLLTFSRGGAPTLKTGRLDSLIKESSAFALSGSNVVCEYRITDDLRQCDFDENQMGQVIDNLVINAQQAMPHGGHILIAGTNLDLKPGDHPALAAGEYVRISISDTGVGMDQELMKRIFDPFFTTKQMGSGLGLTTCYSILRKHSGAIDVESEPGKGSTFHLLLPASTAAPTTEVAQAPSNHRGSGTILVMDDEIFIRELLGEMLVEMGYAVVEAKDGEEALRVCTELHAQGTNPECVILDLTIPGGLGGKETILEMRRLLPDTPAFASSGYSDSPVMAAPTDFGFTDCIRKPYRAGELAALLNRYLPNHLR